MVAWIDENFVAWAGAARLPPLDGMAGGSTKILACVGVHGKLSAIP